MSTCTTRNGTYSCQLEAGHHGRHENRRKIIDGKTNTAVGVTVSRFADGYSPVGQRRVMGVTK